MNLVERARYQERAEWLTLTALGNQIRCLQEAIYSRRLEHDEAIQAGYGLASLVRQRDAVHDSWLSWKRVVARLEGAPVPRGSISLAVAPRAADNPCASRRATSAHGRCS
jgi:hypothetical protein